MTEEEKMSPAARAAYVQATFPEVVEQIRREAKEELVKQMIEELGEGKWSIMKEDRWGAIVEQEWAHDWLRSHLPPEAPQDP